MNHRFIGSLSDLDDGMALVHPKAYFLGGFEILQCCFGREGQQSDRGLEKDDPGLGSPHRSPQLYEGINRDWGNGGRGWNRDFRRWEREHFGWRRWFLGADWAEKGDDDYPGAEGLEHTSLQPAKREVAHLGGLRVVANRRGVGLFICRMYHQRERIT